METITVNTDFENYVLSCIYSEDYGITCNTDNEKLDFLIKCFKSEFVTGNNNKGTNIKLFTEWSQGLPSSFNIAFTNYDILNLSVLFGFIPANSSDSIEDDFLNNWFSLCAKTVIGLCKKNNVELPIKY